MSDELDVTYRLVVAGDHVRLTSLRSDPVDFYPADADHYDNPMVCIGMVRDRAGRVTGMTASTGRVKSVLFRRLPGAPGP